MKQNNNRIFLSKYLILFFMALLNLNLLGCEDRNSLPPTETSSPNLEPQRLETQPSMTKSTSIEEKIVQFNEPQGWQKDLIVDGVLYDLYIPPNYGKDSSLPCLLVLPGWDYPRTSWVENAPLVDYANRYGYALVLPEMWITLYESQYYPETDPALKWHSTPGGQFIKETFIPHIQQTHNLLKPGQHNTMLGLSTGGRGVALIALENPDLFVAGASLSGDFSQENMADNGLMTGMYGSFSEFSDRWLGRDNPQMRVDEWKMPLYLAHGTADDVVPESQSQLFYQVLLESQGARIRLQYAPVTGAGHDYEFWGGQLEEVFQFINRN